MKESDTGNNIFAETGEWNFGSGVEKNFDIHIKNSILGYEIGNYIALLLSDPFVKKGSQIIDIGCSTGKFTRDLLAKHISKNPKIIGIDNKKNMLEKCIQEDSTKTIKYTLLDVIKDKIPSHNDMVTSFYTMQFIPPSSRQAVFDKIYNSLNWGGGFFLYEKIRAPDARFQDYLNHAYTNFKLEKFSSSEIIAKANSLIGVMEPFSSQGNIDLMKRAGFKDICTVSKVLCFEGFLAIK